MFGCLRWCHITTPIHGCLFLVPCLTMYLSELSVVVKQGTGWCSVWEACVPPCMGQLRWGSDPFYQGVCVRAHARACVFVCDNQVILMRGTDDFREVNLTVIGVWSISSAWSESQQAPKNHAPVPWPLPKRMSDKGGQWHHIGAGGAAHGASL